ncbi:MAG: sialidase family protein, partial [Chitinophagales bacterium]
MKKVLILTAVIGALLAASFYFLQDNEKDTLAINDQGFIINKYNTPAGEVANEVNWTRPKKNNKDERGIKHAAKYLNMLRSNPDGEYNPMDYYRARVALNNKNNSTAKKAAALGLEWELLGPNNIAGRNRGFLIDKDNPNKLYTGGVTGGMFVSEDLGESWYPHPQTSEWDFLGISSIQQAPNGDIYFGTGEYFVFTTGNASGHLGGGIYKSTDGGETFEVLPSTIPNPNDDNDTWSYVTEIAIDPSNSNKIYATTATGARNTASLGGGLQISNDGGQTWNTPTISSTHENREALEVVVNSDGVVFLCQNRRYFRSVNGTEFDLMSGQGGFPEFGVERIEFAVSPTDPNYVYALISNGSSALRGIYKSTDAGLTWETISPENSETFNPLGSQGFYDMCIAVSPQDKERVFIGGQVEFYAGQAGGWNLIASSFGGGTSPYYIHADMHGIHPHPNNPDLVFIISDGGTFKTKNASNQFPTFEDANKLCHTTQFYTVQADDLGRSIGGTQDNGVQLIDGQRNSTATSNDLPGFGDGGYSAISEINRNAMFGQSQFGQLRRSSNGGESFGGFYDEKVDAVNNNNTSDPTPDG